MFGRVRADQTWAGSPAERVGGTAVDWPGERPPHRTRWLYAYALSALTLALLPLVSFAVGALVLAAGMRGSADLVEAMGRAFVWLIPATLVVGIVFAVLVLVLVRLLSIGLAAGTYPIRSRASSRRCGCECSGRTSARTSRHPPCSSSRR